MLISLGGPNQQSIGASLLSTVAVGEKPKLPDADPETAERKRERERWRKRELKSSLFSCKKSKNEQCIKR